jgi:hypothetical protein
MRKKNTVIDKVGNPSTDTGEEEDDEQHRKMIGQATDLLAQMLKGIRDPVEDPGYSSNDGEYEDVEEGEEEEDGDEETEIVVVPPAEKRTRKRSREEHVSPRRSKRLKEEEPRPTKQEEQENEEEEEEEEDEDEAEGEDSRAPERVRRKISTVADLLTMAWIGSLSKRVKSGEDGEEEDGDDDDEDDGDFWLGEGTRSGLDHVRKGLEMLDVDEDDLKVFMRRYGDPRSHQTRRLDSYMERMESDLERHVKDMQESFPTVVRILSAPTTEHKRKRLLYKFLILDSPDDMHAMERVELLLNMDQELNDIEAAAAVKGSLYQDTMAKVQKKERDSLMQRILKSDAPEELMVNMLLEYDRMKTLSAGSQEQGDTETWLESCLRIPFGKLSPLPVMKSKTDTANMLTKDREDMDRDIALLDDVKQAMIEYKASMLLNPGRKGKHLLFLGPAGVGKSHIARKLGAMLNRPVVFIPLGGSGDPYMIRGSDSVYVGSHSGEIVQGLQDARVMNPIFVLDEVDKVQTGSDRGMTQALIHLLDAEHNSEFKDSFFQKLGPIDISSAMFVCTANHLESVNPFIVDRVNVCRFPPYTGEQKCFIAKTHLIKRTLKVVGIVEDLDWPEQAMMHFIKKSKIKEAGVRQLQRNLERFLEKINYLRMTCPDRKALWSNPIRITESLIEECFVEDVHESGPPTGMYM